MLVRSSILLLAIILSTACGAPPKEEQTPPSQQQLAPPPPVTLGDNYGCSFTGPSTGYVWRHEVYKYSDGSVFTSCEVADGYYSTTNVALFRANQVGASTGACALVSDWDSPTNGYWQFTFNGSTSSTAKYVDPGSSYNGTVMTMPCTKY